MIPLSKPCIDGNELKAVKKVLESGWLTDGPKNREFEELFAKYHEVEKAITVNSCASALFIVLKALEITGEVIIPSFTFSATANTVVTAGAKPVFADIDFGTGNIGPKSIKSKITSRTEAIMPVHFAGQSCQMDEIVAICDKHKLALIEDSAEAIGAMYKNKKTGSFGIGCFSFFPTKNMTTGEGGMVTTNDEALADKIKILCAHGIPRNIKKDLKQTWHRSATLPGYNFRMSNILAAIGVEQLKKLDKMNNLRRQHAKYLNEHIDKTKVKTPIEEENCYHVYQMYTIKVESDKRDKTVQYLKNNGIGASVHFDPPVHLQDYYIKNYPARPNELLITEKLAKEIITLPMYPELTKKQLDNMVNIINNIEI